MWVVRTILIALVIVCVVAFAFYNIGPANEVDVNLIYVTYTNVPMVTVVFWSFVAGILISLLLFVSIYVKVSVEKRTAVRRVRALESEVTILRNRPIEESADLLKGTDMQKTDITSPFDADNRS